MGYQHFGQLGVKSNDPKKITPTLVEFPDVKEIISVACGRDHCLALSSDGIVYSWGCNNDGQLGLTHLNSKNTPSQVGLDKVVAIAAGWCHSIALKKEENEKTRNVYCSLWGWGLNSSGQLGITDQSLKKAPWHISFFDEAKSVKEIGCGNCHTFAITETNDLYAWGYNGYGQLGFGDAVTKVQPTLLRSNTTWCFVTGKTPDASSVQDETKSEVKSNIQTDIQSNTQSTLKSNRYVTTSQANTQSTLKSDRYVTTSEINKQIIKPQPVNTISTTDEDSIPKINAVDLLTLQQHILQNINLCRDLKIGNKYSAHSVVVETCASVDLLSTVNGLTDSVAKIITDAVYHYYGHGDLEMFPFPLGENMDHLSTLLRVCTNINFVCMVKKIYSLIEKCCGVEELLLLANKICDQKDCTEMYTIVCIQIKKLISVNDNFKLLEQTTTAPKVLLNIINPSLTNGKLALERNQPKNLFEKW